MKKFGALAALAIVAACAQDNNVTGLAADRAASVNASAAAPAADAPGAVYALTNQADDNAVATFSRAGDGSLTWLGSVATGGLAAVIAPETQLFDHVDVDLTLQGLKIVWDRNRKPS